MKEVMKSKKVKVGITGDLEDMIGYLEGAEVWTDDGDKLVWSIGCQDKVTIKVGGKVVEAKDVQITFEDN